MKRFKRLAYLGLGLVLAATLSWPTNSLQAQIDPTAQQTNWAQAQAVDVGALRSHLAAQDWPAADAETRRILDPWIHPRGDILSPPLATNIPPEVLQTLDQLWVEASDGRFGFSVQQKIWAEVRAANPVDSAVAAKAFGDRVGWTRPAGMEDPTFIAGEWLTEQEINPSLDAPVGHLPWAGVSWEQIRKILTVESCGSCTIDAMYLQGERFNQYIPVLFNWVDTALELPVPAIGSWQQPQLARSIDLKSLYPDSQCPIRTASSAISPNGAVIAIGSYSYERSCTRGESALALWNAERGNRIITLHRGPALEASAQGNPPQEPAGQGTRIVGDVANAVAFTPDSQMVAAGMSYGVVRLWSATTGEQIRTFQGHRYAVRAIAISPDGTTLASASADQTLKLWNLQTGQLLRTISMNAADGMVHTLRFSPNGQRLATATDQNTLQLWDATTGQQVRTLVNRAATRSPLLPLAFSPDGQILATGDRDNSVKLWNATTGARQLTLTGHTEPVRHLAFSPDSQRLATSDGKTARLWNRQTNETVHTLTLNQSAGHPIQPTNLGEVAFSPDGQTLATSTLLLPLVQSEPIPGQGMTLWSVATGQSLSQIHDVGQFQFSPDGRFLMAQGQRVQLWQPYRGLVQ
ncbi:GUN4 domain-containing protein [Nodosilinea sp. FACHB-131]|uniref:GUN4 domain-containing protein n=1 Tax=Cyanophyceae TaxID=3028117 RepID=UPI0016841304|nr:GUN4 domain-containing protein [Nodosilinea sp. FACHB-131]MBD1872890.1 GUN4 domain-containing protein [Nodosilinea sp. FACHB-131]